MTASVIGRVLFVLGSAVFLSAALEHGRTATALGSLLFLAGSLLYLYVDVTSRRSRASAGRSRQQASSGGS